MYTLRTLGSCRVLDAEGKSHDAILSQPRRFALLVYLAASEREYQTRNKIASLFWPNARELHARGALKQAVFAIRRALGPDIIVSRGGLGLGINTDVLQCDVTHFRDAVRKRRFQEAVALYGGDFLESFHLHAEPEFQSWVVVQRRLLAEDYRLARGAEEQLHNAKRPVEENRAGVRSLAQEPPAAGGDRVDASSRRRLTSVAMLLATVVAVATIAGAARRR